MITLNNIIIKQKLSNIIQKYDKDVKEVKANIENIKTFSDILEVENINKLDNTIDNDLHVLYYLKAYEEIIKVNDYSFCKCPLCKLDNTLNFHKTYERNIILHINGYEIIGKINLIVLECSFCKEVNKDKQRYHTLIPDFIFPYHIYSSNIVMNALIDRYVNKLKIENILEKIKISHQLFYKWLRELKQYLVVTSTILETKVIIEDVLKEAKEKMEYLQYIFYQNYYHPYFLFKRTCVPLVIMP